MHKRYVVIAAAVALAAPGAGCGSSQTTVTVTAPPTSTTQTVTRTRAAPTSTTTTEPSPATATRAVPTTPDALYTDPHGMRCVRVTSTGVSHVFPNGYCSPAYQLTDSSGHTCSSEAISPSGHCPYVPRRTTSTAITSTATTSTATASTAYSTTTDANGVECSTGLVDPKTGLCVKP
jgi:hypothetical protein